MLNGLEPGDHVVRFSDPSGQYQTEWYADGATPEAATVLTLPAGANRDAIDGWLQTAPSFITGTLTTAGGGPIDAQVTVLLGGRQPVAIVTSDAVTGQFRAAVNPGTYLVELRRDGYRGHRDHPPPRLRCPAHAAARAQNGRFRFDNPEPGRYVVYAQGVGAFLGEYWPDATTEASATPILVSTEPATGELVVQLERASTISGRVSDEHGNLLAYRSVWAYDGNGNQVVWTHSDFDGTVLPRRHHRHHQRPLHRELSPPSGSVWKTPFAEPLTCRPWPRLPS